MFRRFWLLGAILAPALIADNGSRYREDFRFEHKLAPGGRFSLEGFNGAVEVTGWDRDHAEITGTKYASREDLLKEIQIDIVNTPDSVSVRVPKINRDKGWWNNGNAGVKFTVRVPRKIQLERINSSNGSITVHSIEGNARLHTSNGSVKVTALNGSLDASTSNGRLELQDINGGMILKTSNGGISATNVKGSFEASTSNGAIRARLSQVPAATPVRASSSNGAIELTLDGYSNNDVRVTTSNSSITLNLPSSVNANVRAATSNANVSTDFEIAMRGSISKHRIEGRIGEGGTGLIDLSSSNGGIRIQRM